MSEKNIKSGKFKVCLDYHINLCKGPCEGFQSEEDYQRNIERIRQILKGKTADVLASLKVEMKEAADRLEFEKAEEIKKTIEALENYKSKSTVVNPRIQDLDVFALYEHEDIVIVNFMRVKNGSVIQTDTLEMRKQFNESSAELLSLAIEEFKLRTDFLNHEIIVPFMPEFGHEGIKYHVPKKGDKRKLLELAHKNAMYYYLELARRKENRAVKNENMGILEQLQKDLGMEKLPRHIECFDNSNIQGAYPVSSLSVFIDGKPEKSMYRHFNIKTVEGPDDYASMEEVVYRRYKRLLEENQPLPDLIVIDGGKGQLNSAYKVLQKLNLHTKIKIIGIAKRLEEIYIPGDKYPLGIDKKSPSNQLIQKIRNEAHRFGIRHHRTRRMRGSLKSELAEIKGIGEKTAHKVLQYFGSIKEALDRKDELHQLIGKSKASLIIQYFEKESFIQTDEM